MTYMVTTHRSPGGPRRMTLTTARGFGGKVDATRVVDLPKNGCRLPNCRKVTS